MISGYAQTNRQTDIQMWKTYKVHTVKVGFSSIRHGSTPKNGNEELAGKWLGFFPSGANQRMMAMLPVSVE